MAVPASFLSPSQRAALAWNEGVTLSDGSVWRRGVKISEGDAARTATSNARTAAQADYDTQSQIGSAAPRRSLASFQMEQGVYEPTPISTYDDRAIRGLNQANRFTGQLPVTAITPLGPIDQGGGLNLLPDDDQLMGMDPVSQYVPLSSRRRRLADVGSSPFASY